MDRYPPFVQYERPQDYAPIDPFSDSMEQTQDTRPKLSELIARDQIALTCEYLGQSEDDERVNGRPIYRDDWKTTLHLQRRRMTVQFHMGLGHKGKEPEVTDVLGCMVMDAQSIEDTDSFEDWADELGYDPDSRKAERIYKATQTEANKLRRLLGDLYQEYLDAENDI
jgi:hypothetical protein